MLLQKDVKRFASWLESQGAEILPLTNEYELVRFRCKKGIGVVYGGKRGVRVSGPLVGEAVDAMKKCQLWDGKPGKRKRRCGSRRKRELIARDGCKCFYCGLMFDDELLTIEHLIALSIGGPDRIENCALACQPCNSDAANMALVKKLEFREARRVNTHQSI